MVNFSKLVNRVLSEVDAAPPSPTAAGLGGSSPSGGLGGLGGSSLGGGGPPPGLGAGGGSPLGGGLGGGSSSQPGQQPPDVQFLNVDDVWHELAKASKDMEKYPELQLKVSHKRKKNPATERRSSLSTGDSEK